MGVWWGGATEKSTARASTHRLRAAGFMHEPSHLVKARHPEQSRDDETDKCDPGVPVAHLVAALRFEKCGIVWGRLSCHWTSCPSGASSPQAETKCMKVLQGHQTSASDKEGPRDLDFSQPQDHTAIIKGTPTSSSHRERLPQQHRQTLAEHNTLRVGTGRGGGQREESPAWG